MKRDLSKNYEINYVKELNHTHLINQEINLTSYSK